MKRQAGFTLIEIMITVVIVGILTAIVFPNYSRYVVRTRLGDAYSALAGAQPAAEQYWSNNRKYTGMSSAVLPANTDYFTFTINNDTATTYTITATGKGTLAGFEFSIDQSGNRTTGKVPAGWVKPANCWVNDKSGKCSS